MNKTIKAIFGTILILTLILALAACNDTEASNDGDTTARSSETPSTTIEVVTGAPCETHEYTTNCDTLCNKCGYKRPSYDDYGPADEWWASAPHQWSSDCDNYCNECDTYRETGAEHTMVNDVCTYCGHTTIVGPMP